MTEVQSGDSAGPSPESYRRRIYERLLDGPDAFEERVGEALAIACEYLDVADGALNRVDRAADTQEVVAAAGTAALLENGARFDHSTAYCHRVTEADDPVAISDAPGEGLADAADYREQGLACYLGAPVYVEGEYYGTVCFVDPDPREHPFGPEERTFVELVAGLLGRELETREYERELAARERRLADRERELERSERKYRSVVETAPNAILLIDAESAEIVEANQAAAALTGREESALEGMGLLEIHPPEYREAYARALSNLTEPRTNQSRLDDGTPLLVRRPDGSDVPIEVSVTTVELEGRTYVQANMRDISDRVERERELRVKNRAIEAASIGITISDAGGDEPVVYANPAFEALTGYEGSEIVGRNCRVLQGEETDPDAVATLRAGIDAEEPVQQELLNYTADGTPFWNEVTVTPVSDETGEVTHYVGFQRDVTERKRRERLVSVLNRVLRHNLRNDMTVVGGHARTLAEGTEGQSSELAARIAETAEELTRVSEKARLLEDAAHEEREPEPRDLVPVAERVADRARELDPGATVTVEAPTAATALATERIERAIYELAENAVLHAAADGADTSDDSDGGDDTADGPTVELGVEPTDDGVVVRVADDGPGLPAMECSVLESGAETQLSHGQGIGLWLVRWIVSQAGGSIDVERATDDGTTIAVQLRTPGDGPVRRSALGNA